MATPPVHLPLTTGDADIAFTADEALAGNVRTALVDAGFNEELFSDHIPPVTHYRLGEENAGFYAEFLTPLHGGHLKRNGAQDATLSKAGITAQKMRYLDLLLISPWSVHVGPKLGVPVAVDVGVRVPNPTSFIVQKVLIHSERHRKKAQDVLYIHDTLELFGASLDELHRLWVDQVRPAMHATTAKRAETIARGLFADVTDTIREAAQMPQDRRITPENIRAACEYGLLQILEAPEKR